MTFSIVGLAFTIALFVGIRRMASWPLLPFWFLWTLVLAAVFLGGLLFAVAIFVPDSDLSDFLASLVPLSVIEQLVEIRSSSLPQFLFDILKEKELKKIRNNVDCQFS